MEEETKINEIMLAVSGALIALLLPIMFQIDDYLDEKYHFLFINAYFLILVCFYNSLIDVSLLVAAKKNISLAYDIFLLMLGVGTIHGVSVLVAIDKIGILFIYTFIQSIAGSIIIFSIQYKKIRKIMKEKNLKFADILKGKV
jgi:hypothetical protein